MERKILLASHGNFASGILSSLNLIYGQTKNVKALDCYVDKNFDLSKTVERIMQENKGKELLVITDLFGGSVNNEFLNYIQKPNFYLVAGLNLPFLIELMPVIQQDKNLKDTIVQALLSAKKSIQFCNLSFNTDVEEEDF